VEARDIIASLNPDPGCPYDNRPVIRVRPEVTGEKEEGKFEVKVHDESLPQLGISGRPRRAGNGSTWRSGRAPQGVVPPRKGRRREAFGSPAAVATGFRVSARLPEAERSQGRCANGVPARAFRENPGAVRGCDKKHRGRGAKDYRAFWRSRLCGF
jgi:hypothetical protein